MGVPRQRIRVRRASKLDWAAANPVLLAGEIGLESDTQRLKAGDGISAWVDLPYITAGSDGFDGNLSSLQDVDLAAAVDGSLLVYDAASSRWIAGPEVTTTEVVNGGNY